jgi:hypothetical protein
MYKLFMVMCVLVNGEMKCTDYDDSTGKIYQELAKCESDAAARFYGMTDVFAYYGQDYESIEVGCNEMREDS